MPYNHLRLGREEPLTDRHRRQDKRPRFKPDDPRGFGAILRERFRDANERNAQVDIGGFDSRRLLKIQLRAGEKLLPQFDAIPGIEIVSQEAETIVLAFATDEGLANFERRLATLAQTGDVTRKELLYVVEDFDRWTRDDRLGTALREQGMPEQAVFMLDVELWPVEAREHRDRLLVSFRQWLQQAGVKLLDTLSQPSLAMVRVRCGATSAETLLRHRDVRTVDLPPRLGIQVEILSTDVNRFPEVLPPAANVPAVVVLDAGLTSGHPLLGAAVGDAQGFVEPNRDANDQVPNGHGTIVAGLALYGDVEARIRAGEFVPSLRLHAGKVFEDDGQDQTEFVERAVDEAVRYFHTEYGCRVFNFSYGDRNKVYDGRHLRGLAYTLDRLTRELGVLFVVPTGNLLATELPENPREVYPEYMLAPSARLLDPAPALNVLTVGGLTLKTATREAQRNEHAIEDHPLAQTGQPAPFTRSGPSIGNAIKPDVVEEAGNWSIPRAGGLPRHRGLGVVSLNSGFATGSAFVEDVGTSYAAPVVAYKAAMLTGKLPGASANLLRAVLVSHARWPQACIQLLDPASNAEGQKRLLRLAGYGQISERTVYESLDDVVTLLAEDTIGNDQHHFYELPVAEEFWRGQRRTRAISIALAYSPEVRTTRLDYRRSKLSFSLVTGGSLDDITRTFMRGRQQGLPERSTNRLITNNERKAGTLQMSRWKFGAPLGNGEKLFVVVTRQDAPWPLPQEEAEPYALAVVLDDSANIDINLYALTQAQLEVRAQVRERARVRG